MLAERILIIDDNPQNQKLARVLLVSEGYEVQAAGSAEEALRVLEAFSPRLILMDLQLPGMDGLELTRRLKSDPMRSSITVIAVTAYAMKGDDARARAAGCDGYVTKPLDIDELCRTIRAHLAERPNTDAADR